jgi:ankyrin repeat protein
MNEKEKCHGMQYKTGLNVDILPFNPSGSCTPGGIYFAREDIFSFILYGKWIREVRLPKGEQIYKNPGKPEKWKAHRVILGKRRKLTEGVCLKLLDEGASIDINDYSFLNWICRKGYDKIIKLLLESDIVIFDNLYHAMIRIASECNHIKIMKILLEYRNKPYHNEHALEYACRKGRYDIAKLLLEQGIDITNSITPISWASDQGHYKVVKLLLEYKSNIDFIKTDDYLYEYVKTKYPKIYNLIEKERIRRKNE